jgi:hypothetical protein
MAAAPLLAQTAPPPGESDSPPACQVLPPQYIFWHKIHVPSYLDDSFEQVKNEVPGLEKLMPVALRNSSAPTTASQLDTGSIVSRASEVIAQMAPRIPDLLAKELVVINPRGDLSDRQFESYEYRIARREDPGHGSVLDEYRSDGVNSFSQMGSTGAATQWLLFYPRNLEESRYRYLGQQRINGHQTYLVAFAQLPSRTNNVMVINTDNSKGKSCSTLLQGLAWIDQSTFQIVRLQTDLLAPLTGDSINNDPPLLLSRRVLDFGKVNIPQRNLTLWLPKVTDITWQKGENRYEERHEYSDFRLFDVTSTIVYGHKNSNINGHSN